MASSATAGAKPRAKRLDADFWADRRFIRVDFHELDHAPKSPILIRKLSAAERASIERARRTLE